MKKYGFLLVPISIFLLLAFLSNKILNLDIYIPMTVTAITFTIVFYNKKIKNIA